MTFSSTLPRSLDRAYRTIRPGVQVQFEIVESRTGLTARNIQRIHELSSASGA